MTDKKKKPHQCYVVVAVCNFDDVLCGVYDRLRAAKARASAIAKNPSLRFTDHQASDTEFLCCRVFKATGEKFKEVAEFCENPPRVPA